MCPFLQQWFSSFSQCGVAFASEVQWLRPQGRNIKTTIVSNRHVLGRLFTGCDLKMLIRAGDPDRVWLPREWLRKDQQVMLIVEGITEDAELNCITIDKR